MSAADKPAPGIGEHPYGSADGARSLGQLFSAATADLSQLVHDEIALAKAEMKKDIKRGATGGAAISVAGVIAMASVPMFSFAAVYAIHTTGLGLPWCFLIMGGVFVVIAAIAGLIAVGRFKKVKPPERTIASTKETVEVLKKAKPRPAVASDARAVRSLE